MAYLQETEEEQQGQQGQQSSQSASITGQPGSALVTRPKGAQQAPQGSGSFVNLQKYIDANKPKAEQMTQKVTGGIKSEADKVKENIAQQRQQYLGSGSQISQEEQRLQQAQPFYQQALEKAGSGLSQEEIDKFRGITGGQGAKLAAPELQQQRASAEDIRRRAQQLGTSEGRFEELQRTVGGQSSTYGGGQRSLDELLLAGDRARRTKALKDVKKATSGFGQQLGDIESTAQQRMAQIAKQRQDLAQQAQTGLTGAQDKLTKSIAEKQAAEQAKIDRIKRDLELQSLGSGLAGAGIESGDANLARWGKLLGRSATPEDRRTFGVLSNQDLAGLIAGEEAKVGREEVMTPEQLSRLQALQRLGGQSVEELQLRKDNPYQRLQEAFSEIEKRRNIYEQEKSGLDRQVDSVQDRFNRSQEEFLKQKGLIKNQQGDYVSVPMGFYGGGGQSDFVRGLQSTREVEKMVETPYGTFPQKVKETFIDPAKVAEAVKREGLLKQAQDTYASDWNKAREALDARLAQEKGWDFSQVLGDQLPDDWKPTPSVGKGYYFPPKGK